MDAKLKELLDAANAIYTIWSKGGINPSFGYSQQDIEDAMTRLSNAGEAIETK